MTCTLYISKRAHEEKTKMQFTKVIKSSKLQLLSVLILIHDKEQPGHPAKHLILSDMEKRKSYCLE